MSKAKASLTLHVHGFSRHKIIGKSLKDLVKTIFIAGGIAYLVLYSYLFISGRLMIFAPFTFFFLLAFSFITLIYLVTCALTMYLIFQMFSSHTAIKGYKPDFFIQILNHVLKVTFMVLFLLGSHFVIMRLTTLSISRAQLKSWSNAEYVHRFPMSDFWYSESEEYAQKAQSLEDLRLELSETHHGFIIHTQNFLTYDLFPNHWEYRSESLPPFEIAPDGNRVDLTLNYLSLNPIRTVDGIGVEEQLIWDEFVVNLLVPLQLSSYEALIEAAYLEDFYYSSLYWHNVDANEEYKLNWIYTSDDLSVNIIYVEDDQFYFTFDAQVRPEDGNLIKDPIAVFHTNNFHPKFMVELMGTSFNFISENETPFKEISELISSYGLDYNTIRFSYSTIGKNIERIRLIEQDIMSGSLILGALMITNFTVNYHLVSNYFWRNKHTLFTKSLFGFSLLKRHKWFIISFLVYVVPIIVITTFFLDSTALVMGLVFLVLDVILALCVEKKLMQKSFAEVMKGER